MVLGWLIGTAVNEISLAADPLTLTVRREKFKGFDVFALYVKGRFKIPWTKGGLMYLINLYEVGGEEKPVLCYLDGFNKDGVFQWISDPIDSDSGVYSMKSNTNILSVPIESLLFSQKGTLSLRFELKLVSFNRSGASVIKEAFGIETYQNTNNGYQNIIENRSVFNDNAVELASVLINIDGIASASEVTVLNNWIKDRITNAERRTELLGKVTQFTKMKYQVTALKEKAKSAILSIDKVAEASDKIALMNLLHDISVADGRRDEVEHKLIQVVLNKLGIDQNEYVQLFSKSVVLDDKTSDSELETLVGIEPKITISEKITQLKKAFKEWNAKVTSANRIESGNAKRVLDFIARKRSQLETA